MKQITNLVPATTFILQDFERELGQDIDAYNLMCLTTIKNYVKFLQRPLELWMLRPCKDGKPIFPPDVQCLRSGTCQCGEEQVSDCRDWKYEYAEAKSKCFFEGFELNYIFSPGGSFEIISEQYDKRIQICIYKAQPDYFIWNYKTIEDIARKHELKLTPAAIKEIYGR